MPRVDWFIRWPPQQGKFFVVRCCSGLGNRLRALVAGMRLARRLPGRTFAVIWNLDNYHCFCPMSCLLTNPFFEIRPESLSKTGFIDLHTVSKSPVFIDVDSKSDIIWVEEENFFYARGDEQVMYGQHSPARMRNEQLKKDFLFEFGQLQVLPAIQKQVDNFQAAHIAGKAILGVHVRQGDNLWANLHVPVPAFFPIVDSLLQSHEGLFLATDCPQARSRFMARYGTKVMVFPCRSLDRGSRIEAVQDALVDMLLLARTRQIVRTASSTFSQCASWWGNVPTVEVGPLEHSW